MEREELIDILLTSLASQKAWEQNEALTAIVSEYDSRQTKNQKDEH